jgi:hypothetical protein
MRDDALRRLFLGADPHVPDGNLRIFVHMALLVCYKNVPLVTH